MNGLVALLGGTCAAMVWMDWLSRSTSFEADDAAASGKADHSVAAAHRSALLMTIVAYLLFILLGRFAVGLVFAPEFAASYRITVVMLMANVFMVPVEILGGYLISTYDLRAYLVGMIAAVVLNIGLNFLLVHNWGINGALAGDILSGRWWRGDAGVHVTN